MVKQKKINLRNIKRKVSRGIVHIKASFNNTIVSVTDMRGNVISWSSSGACGFKGSRKGTPFASQTVTESAVRKAMDQGIRQVEINVSGPGSGRETAIRSIQNFGLGILLIRDVTLIPHNGCRPSKKRRI
uniref:Small ribosomal subunit protein uS11c n=1 Tax=Euglena archaeoplastidiata TaxID=1188008 RepID=A0A1X9GCL8_9EUGL|nr:ribosomal protein S11 [Euglena archaeoplastidiata]AKR17880.1 ribosomal protein S11 [Euglena archaeoplastidiata]